MASGNASASFSEATKVEQLDSHTYRVELSNAFCVGAGTFLLLRRLAFD
jgi:hypothetical protein